MREKEKDFFVFFNKWNKKSLSTQDQRMEKRNYEQEQNRSGERRAIGILIGVKLNTVGIP